MSLSTSSNIHSATTVGPIRLAVADLARMTRFYVDVIGLTTLRADSTSADLGTKGGALLVQLTYSPDTIPATRRSPGLFQQAILLPTRVALGRLLLHLSETGWRLSGAGDHLVSEALYLDDPEGNGIELYVDRPRETWEFKNGHVQMDTLPVDIDSLVKEGQTDATPWTGIDEGATMGHIHLKVSHLEASRHFYQDILGFNVMASMPQALFLSAGGYHHHLGLNTWMSAGMLPPAPNVTGLRHFGVNVPDLKELDRIKSALTENAIPFETRGDGIFVQDPSQNGILIQVGV